MKVLSDVPFNRQLRMRTMEVLLINYGYFNRDVICDFHEVAIATVSRDITLYKKLNSGVYYNIESKRTEKLIDFKPIFGANTQN